LNAIAIITSMILYEYSVSILLTCDNDIHRFCDKLILKESAREMLIHKLLSVEFQQQKFK